MWGGEHTVFGKERGTVTLPSHRSYWFPILRGYNVETQLGTAADHSREEKYRTAGEIGLEVC